jgi:hypothetical protein
VFNAKWQVKTSLQLQIDALFIILIEIHEKNVFEICFYVTCVGSRHKGIYEEMSIRDEYPILSHTLLISAKKSKVMDAQLRVFKIVV